MCLCMFLSERSQSDVFGGIASWPRPHLTPWRQTTGSALLPKQHRKRPPTHSLLCSFICPPTTLWGTCAWWSPRFTSEETTSAGVYRTLSKELPKACGAARVTPGCPTFPNRLPPVISKLLCCLGFLNRESAVFTFVNIDYCFTSPTNASWSRATEHQFI